VQIAAETAVIALANYVGIYQLAFEERAPAAEIDE
jgi:hypothetical protein